MLVLLLKHKIVARFEKSFFARKEIQSWLKLKSSIALQPQTTKKRFKDYQTKGKLNGIVFDELILKE